MIYIILITLLLILSVLGLWLKGKCKTIESNMADMQTNYFKSQSLVQKLVHDIKNPLATTAMAVHNLQFGAVQDLSDVTNQELIETINESIKETTHKLQQTSIYCRVRNENFRNIDPLSFVENNLPGNDSHINIITDFPDSLPPIYADPQALDLVVQELLSLCQNQSQQKEIIHISIEKVEPLAPAVKYKFFNHKFLSSEAENQEMELQVDSILSEHFSDSITLIKTILARHQSTLKGVFDPAHGCIFSFKIGVITG